MRSSLCLCAFVFLCLIPCYAQETPAWEVFGGYSVQPSNVRDYYKSTPTIYAIRNRYENLQGWDFAVTENMNRWFGGTLDVSGHYKTVAFQGTNTRQQIHSLLYGPRFSLRKGPFVPFLHVLFGFAHADARVSPGPHASENSFAVAGGGGLDLSLFKQASVRVLQADYFRANALGSNQNNYRASAGIVFHLGRKR